MVSKPQILDALQYPLFNAANPINATSDPALTITYQYAGTSAPADLPTGSSYTGWTNFSGAEKAAFQTVLATVETFLNVHFVEVTGSSDPDINVGKVTIPGSTIGVGGYSVSYWGSTINQWDGYVVYDNTLNLAAPAQESLLFHELGHALGLKHPHSGTSTLPTAEDSNKFTVMSYNNDPDNGMRSDGMMLYDVYALQDIWGQAAYNVGNTAYTGARTNTVDTVWDTAGSDTFNAASRSLSVALDLRQGHFSTFDTTDDVVIAYGTKIENAVGGAGDDSILGNGLSNSLKGAAGADTIKGFSNHDTIRGQAGNDVLFGHNGNDKMYGDSGDDGVFGGAGNDELRGGYGNDILHGGGGNDLLVGNSGQDVFKFKALGGHDIIKDFADNIDTLQLSGFGFSNVADALATAQDVNNNTVFSMADGSELTLLGILTTQLSDDLVVV